MFHALAQPQNQGAASGSHSRTPSGAALQQYKSAARVEGASDDEDEEDGEAGGEGAREGEGEGEGEAEGEGSGSGGVDTMATAAGLVQDEANEVVNGLEKEGGDMRA